VSTSTPPNVLLIASLLWAAQQNGHPELNGKTPMVYLNIVADECVANIAAKLEYMGPYRSAKDRIGLRKINDAKEKDLLVSLDKTNLGEPITGNIGVDIVFVAAAKGYKLLATMPSSLDVERHSSERSF
jgi:cysteine synthase